MFGSLGLMLFNNWIFESSIAKAMMIYTHEEFSSPKLGVVSY
jgi:hypothetical protein